ncbi:unnamed protein product [Adineta steineri]|uniref:Uncharacterized protein n=3 Tax=Adineta steineri TaxID=433720 RepID=A0A814RXY6_9BILA|nr:unnamed protein product [Adineta steineri]
MGFGKFYRTRLSPFVTIAALFIGIHISWWSIQQNPALVAPSERRGNLLGLRIPYLSPPTDDKEKKERIFAPTGGSISFATAVFIAASWSACFYLLVPLEYIRPDIIGWNRSARARELLTKKDEEQKIIVK